MDSSVQHDDELPSLAKTPPLSSISVTKTPIISEPTTSSPYAQTVVATREIDTVLAGSLGYTVGGSASIAMEGNYDNSDERNTLLYEDTALCSGANE